MAVPPTTVLIVDDSDFLRMMLEDILSRSHHNILQVKSGEECLETLQTQKVDVCVLDIMMPGMGGLEALKRIKENYQDIKVIMLSALCSEETVKKALELGADSFVAKPFQGCRILERI